MQGQLRSWDDDGNHWFTEGDDDDKFFEWYGHY